jgi:hypothetical protein
MSFKLNINYLIYLESIDYWFDTGFHVLKVKKKNFLQYKIINYLNILQTSYIFIIGNYLCKMYYFKDI